MVNRDRDGRRLGQPAREPEWSDWSADQDEDDSLLDQSAAAARRDLPAWSSDAPPARHRGPRPSDSADQRGTGALRGGEPSRLIGGRGRLPELSRTLTGGRTRRREPLETPAPDFAASETPEEWSTEDVPSAPAGSRRPTRVQTAGRAVADRRYRRDLRSRTHQPRPAPSISIPPTIAHAAFFQDRMLLGIAGVTAASLALMAAIVGNRIGQMPPAVVLHLNAAGMPDLWGTRETLWRLPLAVAMLSVMNVVAGAFLLDRNAFVARFLVASSLLINLLAWIAVGLLFW